MLFFALTPDPEKWIQLLGKINFNNNCSFYAILTLLW